jgi:hypothetical protein
MLDWLRRMMERAPRSWPEDIPRLYPTLSPLQIGLIAPPEQAHEQRRATVVLSCPLHEPHAQPAEAAIGLGASRVLLDGLSRVPGLSVRGPEDTPPGALPVARRLLQSRQPADVLISGRVRLSPRPQADIILLWRHRAEQALTIREPSAGRLLLSLLSLLSEALGGTVTPALRTRWSEALPPSLRALEVLGAQLSMARPDNAQLISLWRQHPAFSTPLHSLRRAPGDTPLLIEACETCPDDPRLHLMAFERLWDGRRYQASTTQYLRRALERGPGLGRAWLYAAHAAHPRADRLTFAELGYRLLPGDPAATSGYVRALRQQHHSAARCVRLAREGIEADPFGPGNYELAIEGLIELGRASEALELARKLQDLYEPEIHERTRRRLWQDPLLRARVCDQSWDPAAEVRQRIARLQRA